MIVLVREDATAEAVRALVASVRELGLDVVALDDAKGRAYEVVGGDPSRVLALADAPAVAEILTRRTPLEGGEPLWPHFLLRAGGLVLVVFVVLSLLAAFLPVGLADPAPADRRPVPGRAEWYLRPLDGLFRLLPSSLHLAGGALVALCCLLFLAWPWLDRSDEGAPGGARRARLVRAGGAAVLVGLVVLGLLP